MMPKQIEVDGVVYVPRREEVWPPKEPNDLGHNFEFAFYTHRVKPGVVWPWIWEANGKQTCGRAMRQDSWQDTIDYIHTLAKGHGWAEPKPKQPSWNVRSATIEKDAKILHQHNRIEELEAEIERLCECNDHDIPRDKPTFWVRETGFGGHSKYGWCDKEGDFIFDARDGHILACNAKAAQQSLSRHGIHVNVKVWDEPEKQNPQDEWVYALYPVHAGFAGRQALVKNGSQNLGVCDPDGGDWLETIGVNGKWNMKWVDKSSTPTFGVRKLREGEPADGYGCRWKWSAYYNGKRIIYSGDNVSPDNCIKAVLDKLTPAVTLADLAVAG